MATLQPLNMSDLSRNITLEIRIVGMNRWKVRMWITVQLLRLVGMVSPTAVDIEIESDADDRHGRA